MYGVLCWDLEGQQTRCSGGILVQQTTIPLRGCAGSMGGDSSSESVALFGDAMSLIKGRVVDLNDLQSVRGSTLEVQRGISSPRSRSRSTRRERFNYFRYRVALKHFDVMVISGAVH